MMRERVAHQGRRRGRLAGFAGVACGLVALGSLAASPASPAGAATALLPDLRTEPHQQLYVSANHSLRLSNTISNGGSGPVEIYPEQGAGGDCDGDGVAANDRLAFQRVFEDSPNPHSPGYFIRSQDTTSTTHQVGCMVYHPQHSHWHFEDFSIYALRREPDGVLMGRSTKISFCVVDTDRPYPTLPGSPTNWFYGRNGCGPASTEGLSIGWADTYDATLAGQRIDVSTLPAGNYCLISRADPVDRLSESNDDNNNRRTRLFLDPPAREVERLTGACQLRG
jgi:hypothetical protein